MHCLFPERTGNHFHGSLSEGTCPERVQTGLSRGKKRLVPRKKEFLGERAIKTLNSIKMNFHNSIRVVRQKRFFLHGDAKSPVQGRTHAFAIEQFAFDC